MCTMDFVKGLGVGMAAGEMVAMAVTPKRRKCKTVMGKALKAAGDIAGNITDAIGL